MRARARRTWTRSSRGANSHAAVVASVTAAFIMAVSATPVAAQWSASPRAAGMAGAGFVFASGYEAAEWNPANLAASKGWSLSLFEVGTSGLLSGTTLSDLYDIATAAGNGDPALVSGLPAAGFSVFSTVEGYALSRGAELADLPTIQAPIPTLGLSFGPFALRVRSQILSEGRISREVADLTVQGFNPERIQEYSVGDTGFRLESFTEVTAAFGHSFGRLHVGAGVRMVRGHQLVQGRLFEPEIDLDQETMTVDAVAVEAPGGSGWGIDLGMAIDLGAGVRWSLAGRNIAQHMTWDDNLRTHQAQFTDSDFDNADFQELIDRFQPTDLDPNAVALPVFEAARGLFEQSYFPSIVRTGLGWTHGSTVIEAVGMAVGPRGRQHAQWDQRLSVGGEQGLGFLVFRAGYTIAEKGLRSLAGGLGLRIGPVRLDMGAGMLSGSYRGIDYDGLQGSIGMSIRGGGA